MGTENARLRGALNTAGLSAERLGELVGVDPKTVGRWISDAARIPHRAHRLATADLLGMSESFLWPAVASDPRTAQASTAELVAFYPSRSAVPAELWKSLVTEAKHRIDVLVMAGLFLPEQQDVSTLAARAGGGLQVRLLLAEPTSDAVLLRGREEGFGLGLCHRVALALRYYEHLIGLPGVELRLHGTTLYNSLFRSDDTLLVNAHLYGSPAGHNPVLHLHRVPGGQVVERYLTSFDKVWAGATACTDIDAVLSDFEKRIHGQA